MSYRERAFERYDYLLSNFQDGLENQARLHRALFEKNIRRHLPKDKSSIVADLGAGFGDLCEYLKSLGFAHVLGVDGSPENVKLIQAKGCEAIQSSILPFLKTYNGFLDCCILYDVLEHQNKEEGLELLDAIFSRLNPNGILIAVVPNMLNPLTAARSRYLDITHEVGFTPPALDFMVHLANFQSIEIHPIDHFVLPNGLFNFFGRMAQAAMHQIFRLMYLVHGVRGTEILSKNILVRAKKPG